MTQSIFDPRVNVGLAPSEAFRKLLVAVFSEGRVRWSRKQVLAAFGYQKLGSSVVKMVTRALLERGIRLTPSLESVAPDDGMRLERIDNHFVAKEIAERLNQELSLLAAGRARLRYQDLLLMCGFVRDGQPAREIVRDVLGVGAIKVSPSLQDAALRDWVYLSVPVEIPTTPPPSSSSPTVPQQKAEQLADELLTRRSEAEGKTLRWRSKQRELTSRFIEGRNTFGVLPCGTGKSLCFQLTAEAIEGQGMTLVVSPLIALITDMTKQPLPGVTALNSSVSPEDRETRLDYLSEGRYHLLYVTPEQLGSDRLLRVLTSGGCRVVRVVIDEAHCVSEWGQSFRVEYLLLRDGLARLGSPPVLLLTATAPPEVRRDVVRQLGIDLDPHLKKDLLLDYWRKNELVPGVTRVHGLAQKYAALRDFVAKQGPGARGIVYTRFAKAGDDDERENVREIAERLQKEFGPVAMYHGQLDTSTKMEQQHNFTTGKANIAVATNAFGLGIDLPDIDWIIHFYMPPSLLDYYQEIGRGAHGLPGQCCKCLLTYDPDDRRLIEGMVLRNVASSQKIATRFHQLLEGRGRQHGLRGPHEVLYDDERKVLLLPFRPMKKQYTVRISHMLALEDIGVSKRLPWNLFRGGNVYAQFEILRDELTPSDMRKLSNRQQRRRDQVTARLDAMQQFCEMPSDDERWAILDKQFST
ncbi:MAG: ATP-dependent DNA helicase RecQ [Rhodopirellula sp.]|nr:ATP-dependent DNA helicase RecQ [Rhodopirellula sp.]